MKALNRSTANINTQYPVKILQFGEGNFLRAFVDWMVQLLNEAGTFQSGITVVQPIEKGMVDLLRQQDGLYHHLLRGVRDGKEIVEMKLNSTIQQLINPYQDTEEYWQTAKSKDIKIIISNTTEAGIEFVPEPFSPTQIGGSFPAKLTQWLYQRYQHFNGSEESGVFIIPCELIEDNGVALKSAIQKYISHWGLEDEFSQWLLNNCEFANTLVDRIVPGFPVNEIDDIRDEIGFQDQLVVASETFHLWVIEASETLRKYFPIESLGLNVIFVEDIKPYRTRKVKILNGAHTSLVAVGIQAQLVTVKEAISDPVVGKFISDMIFSEICPTINLPEEELNKFATEIIDRFRNPFIRHLLSDIALNSMAKLKVRVLPSLLDYYQLHKTLPVRLTATFAAMINLYLEPGDFKLKDNEEVIAFCNKQKGLDTKQAVINILSNTDFWNIDLTTIPSLAENIVDLLSKFRQHGFVKSITSINENE